MAQIVSNGVDDVMRQEFIIFLLNWENNGGGGVGGGVGGAIQPLNSYTHTQLSKQKLALPAT